MSDNNNHPLGQAPWFHVIISTGLGTGFIPGAPGTYAGFTGLVIWFLLYLLVPVQYMLWITLALIVVTTFVGVWTSNVMERYWGPDPRTVVIDEYVGTWIPLIVAPCCQGVWSEPWSNPTWILALLGFALFRLIDIFKPLGCRRIEHMVPGGWGVMLDDVLAGIYALIICSVVKMAFWPEYSLILL